MVALQKYWKERWLSSSPTSLFFVCLRLKCHDQKYTVNDRGVETRTRQETVRSIA